MKKLRRSSPARRPNVSLSAIAKVEKIVERAKKSLRASSCAFYVRDPVWKGDFRLVALPGVKFGGTMHGFLTSETSKKVVLEGESATFVRDARTDPSRRSPNSESVDRIPGALGRLFGDFVEREGVVSSARLLHRTGQQVEAALFVNYSRRNSFSEPLQKRIKRVMSSLVPYFDELSRELQDRDAPSIGQMIGVLKPAQELATTGFDDPAKLDKFFESILDAAMEAVRLDSKSGIGTIHLFQESTETLFLKTERGDIKYRDKAQSYSVKDGRGVISWVAHRRRALMIPDVKASPFSKKGVYVPFRDDIRSELVVPMLAGPTLLGVLNLESAQKEHFRNPDVRAIAYLANAAAVAARLSREAANNLNLARLNSGLLDVFCDVPGNLEVVSSTVPEVARLASNWLEADRCLMWFYDPELPQLFYNAGATDDTLHGVTDLPRRGGWSHYLCRNKKYIWISNIQRDHFEAELWDSEKRVWHAPAPSDEVPTALHPKVFARGVSSQIGIPILVRGGECRGVAWVDYDKPKPHPGKSYMRLAEGFAGGAGLIMDCIRLREEEVQSKPDQHLLKALEGALFPTSCGALPCMSSPEIEGYVIRKVKPGQLGGDFYACESLGSDSIGVLLGDGKAKGATGALFMLPMITAFRCYMDSHSPSHVIEKLAALCKNTRVRAEGTALYFIIRKINGQIKLSVSSAGHPPLCIMSSTAGFSEFPKPNSDAQGMGFYPDLDFSVGEERIELVRNDVVIGYTDGISEAGSRAGKSLTVGGIHEAAESTKSRSPKEIAHAIMKRAEDLEQPLLDDATVLVLRIK